MSFLQHVRTCICTFKRKYVTGGGTMFPLLGSNRVNKQKTVFLMMMYPQAAMHGTMRRPSKGRHAHSTQAGGSQQEYCCPGRWIQLKCFSWLCLCLSFCLCLFLSLSFFLFLSLSAGERYSYSLVCHKEVSFGRLPAQI